MNIARRFNPLRRGAVVGVAMAAGLALAACSLPINRASVQQSYRLTAADIDSPPLPRPTVIQLLPVRASAGFQSPAMMYSRSPDTLDAYRDSRWLAPPAQLVGEAIAHTLSRQPWVSAVQQQTVLVRTPWILHCSLNRLEHDVRAAQGAVRLDLTCELTNPHPGHIVAHWRFDGSQPLAVSDASHFAQGAQTLLDRALAGIVQQTRAAVAAAQASNPAP